MTSYNWLHDKQASFYTFPVMLSTLETKLCAEYVRAERYIVGGESTLASREHFEQAGLERLDTLNRPNIPYD